LWRRPRPKVGCGAKERRKKNFLKDLDEDRRITSEKWIVSIGG
jgi:hypothetical protein